jgi:hypothetical protein
MIVRCAIPLLALLNPAAQAAPPTTAPATTQSSLYVGEVLGRPVHVDRLPQERGARIAKLHELLSRPLFERYYEDNKQRVDPTEPEIGAYNALLGEGQQAQVQRDSKRREEVKRELADPTLAGHRRAELERELSTLDILLDDSEEARERKRKVERHFADWWIRRWKLNQALYSDFGGGRLLWQQFGTEAWDATRRFYESHEQRGLLKFASAELREDFYDYWSRDQGSFVHNRADELLNPPWQAKPATTPATTPTPAPARAPARP